MHIAFIVPYLYRFQRGIESSACRLASALSALGHEVTILTWAQPKPRAEPVLSPDVRVLTVPYFRYFRSRIAEPFYTRYLKRGQFDLVNIYFADCGEAGPIRKTRTKAGYRVQFIAGYPVELVPHRFDAFDRLGLTPLIDRVVVKSPAMEPGIRARLGRPIVTIPNGVDTERFSPVHFAREKCLVDLNLAPDATVILSVAALEERKGIQFVLSAMPELIKRRPRLCYLIAGEGPYRPVLESQVERLGLKTHVRFMGRLEDVRPLLGAAGLLALLSYGEGLPNVLLEAWSMGCPVLVSRHPPYPDLMADSLGEMVTENESEQVTAALERLLEGRTAPSDAMRRRHVVEHYSWRQVAEEIAAVGVTKT